MGSRDFLRLMAVGDAFGMKYEFVQRDKDISADDLNFGSHPTFKEYQAGCYTDDTQMSLANAELLLSKENLEEISDYDFVEEWLKAYKRDPRSGYSKHMYQIMNESNTPHDFITLIDPQKGITSGAAMRAAPFGLLSDIEQVVSLTTQQAKLTHDTDAGITSALAVSLSTHFLHHAGRREDLSGFLENKLGQDWYSATKGYSDDPKNGLKIVSLALNAVIGPKTLGEVLLKAVNQDYMSDTDTVCALAFAMASRCNDIENDLTEKIYHNINEGEYGMAYLSSIDDVFLRRYPPTDMYRIL